LPEIFGSADEEERGDESERRRFVDLELPA
jgi:hypothetical protein